MLIGGCPGPSGVNNVVLSDLWCLIQCSPCLSHVVLVASCAASALAFGCVASMFVEGAPLGLHILPPSSFQ